MATRKQKQELVDALKFTPRDIEITLSGYGGEIVMGRISEAVYDFWRDRNDLDDYATSWDDEFEEEVPADARFIDCGSWHDVDDICHESGCTADDGSWLTVEDALERKVLLETSTHLEALDKHGIDTSGHSHVRAEDLEPGTCVFLAQNFEKGVFFSGTVRITRPFDPRLLSVYWTDCDGWRLIGGVTYDGEDVEGHDAYSTSGKGMEFKVYRVEKDSDDTWDEKAELDRIMEDIPVLEGEEIWASEAIDAAGLEHWQGIPLTPWWTGDQLPVRVGEYEAMIGTWPFPQMVYWDGYQWVQDGEHTVVQKWRGLACPVE